MTAIWVPLAWLGGSVALLAWFVLMVWMTNRSNERMKAMELESRYRRLELNLPEIDPEQARGERERQRTLLIGLTGILVPLGVCAALVVLTVLSLESRTNALSLPLLLTVWPAGLAVCLGTAALSLWLLRRPEAENAANAAAPPTNSEAGSPAATGIREGPVGR
jgi:hypothetical protein